MAREKASFSNRWWLDGPAPRIETESTPHMSGNAVGDFTNVFVDADRGDLHIKPPAAQLSEVARLAAVAEDIDGKTRTSPTTQGAHQPY